jgi:DNA-binding NtrC family response regulator
MERYGSVIVASDDQRFAKLARFLLDSHGIGVARTVTPDRLVGALDERPDVVVLDAGERLATSLRIANAARARRPGTAIVMVGEGAAERAPAGMRIYHKWDETDEAVTAVEEALASR